MQTKRERPTAAGVVKLTFTVCPGPSQTSMIFAWVSLYAYMPVGLSRGASGTFAWAKSVKLWMLEWALTRVRFTVWFGSTWIADGGKVNWRGIVPGRFGAARA